MIVLLELESVTEKVDSAEVDIGARVRWVHAAGADPDAPEDGDDDAEPDDDLDDEGLSDVE